MLGEIDLRPSVCDGLTSAGGGAVQVAAGETGSEAQGSRGLEEQSSHVSAGAASQLQGLKWVLHAAILSSAIADRAMNPFINLLHKENGIVTKVGRKGCLGPVAKFRAFGLINRPQRAFGNRSFDFRILHWEFNR